MFLYVQENLNRGKMEFRNLVCVLKFTLVLWFSSHSVMFKLSLLSLLPKRCYFQIIIQQKNYKSATCLTHVCILVCVCALIHNRIRRADYLVQSER